jgi:hypothetical protein
MVDDGDAVGVGSNVVAELCDRPKGQLVFRYNYQRGPSGAAWSCLGPVHLLALSPVVTAVMPLAAGVGRNAGVGHNI